MPITPGTEGAALLTQEYDSDIRLKPNEELVLAKNFTKPQGVEKITNQLTIRIIPVVSPVALAATAAGTTLTYHTGTTTSVNVSPTFSYGAVEIPWHLLSKLLSADQASVKAGYRKQIMSALSENIDSTAGSTLGPNVSTTVGAPSNFDKSLLLNAAGTLQTNAKEGAKLGSTRKYLCYHPSQYQYLNGIAEIANANLRGDSQNPNVKGVVMDAWGLELAESGNIYSTGGNTYNMLHTKEAFVLGYNQEPRMLAPQDFELVVRLIAFTEFGVQEIFDEYAVVILSP